MVNQFRELKKGAFDSSITRNELVEKGKRLQFIITSIAYSFPYKQMISFNKDGSTTFNPNNQYSIDLNKDVQAKFLLAQINEIINLQYHFVYELIDGKDKVIKAISAFANLNNKDALEVDKYINSLIEYFNNHYRLAISLGMIINKCEYFNNKLSKKYLIYILLINNFFFGIILMPSL